MCSGSREGQNKRRSDRWNNLYDCPVWPGVPVSFVTQMSWSGQCQSAAMSPRFSKTQSRQPWAVQLPGMSPPGSIVAFQIPRKEKPASYSFIFPVLFASYFISWLRPKPPRHSLSPQRRIIHLMLNIKVYTSSLGFLLTSCPFIHTPGHPSPPLTHTPQHTLIKKH